MKLERAFLLGLSSVVFALTSACVVIPHRGKVFGPGGEMGTVDLRFLRTGSTERQEVRSRLEMVDVHLRGDTVFWGRWRRKWDVYWMAAGGGETAATAGSGALTIWRRRNILIEFDASQKVSGFRAVGDSDLLSTLAALAQQSRVDERVPADSATFVSAEGERISFKDGRASFGGLLARDPRFDCGFDRLTRVTVATESDESGITLRLVASVPGDGRRAVRRLFTLTPSEVYAFVKFAVANRLERILVDTSSKEQK